MKARIAWALLISLALGFCASGAIRPAAADAGSEIVRIRSAVESIAHSLERCPR